LFSFFSFFLPAAWLIVVFLPLFLYFRLYFWHAFFGVPGAQNDINVLDCSTLFTGLLEGTAPQVHYIVNNRMYKMGYYLADGIYPEWRILMKTISNPQTPKQTHYAQRQESRRKDVERGFGGVQVCFFVFFLLSPLFDCHLSNFLFTFVTSIAVQVPNHIHAM